MNSYYNWGFDFLRRGIGLHQSNDPVERRDRNQSPLLEMIGQDERDEQRDRRPEPQIPAPASPLQRIGIDKSIRRRAAEAQYVAVLELLRATNPFSIDERAAGRFEIDYIVPAASISDDRMTSTHIRIRYLQRRTVRAAHHRFITRQQQQPGVVRLAINCEQSSGLRSFQHLRLLSGCTVGNANIQNTNAPPFAAGGGAGAD
ncbi:MAG TPA: hypothetical protein VGR40_06665 [Candidatus Binatus sp.]|nr:hypothetical protein [Candidatus Binatus sp.]